MAEAPSQDPDEELTLRSLVEEEILIGAAGLPADECYGNAIRTRLGAPSGLFYPAARRLAERGLLSMTQEDGDTTALGRPLRTYYSIPDEARQQVETYLDAKIRRIQAALEKLRPSE